MLLFLILTFSLFLFPFNASALDIVVGTDLHYISPSLKEDSEYFLQIIMRGDGKVSNYCEEITLTFIDEVLTEKPSLVLLTGDLTFNGAVLSHQELAVHMQRLLDAGIPVYVLPGNHDVYSPNAARFVNGRAEPVDSADSETFRQIWHAFGYDQSFSQDTISLSYAVDLPDSITLIAVDANTQDNIGILLPETAGWISDVIRDAETRGRRILCMSHQPLLSHNTLFSTVYSMGSSEDLAVLYTRESVIANLCGHMHIQHIAQEPFLEFATSSMAVAPNQYAQVSIREDELQYQVRPLDVPAWAAKNNKTDSSLLEFQTYSPLFLLNSSLRMSYSKILELHPDTASDLVSYVCSLNSAYFTGDLSRFHPTDREYSVLCSDGAGYSPYIISLYPDLGQNYRQYSKPLQH